MSRVTSQTLFSSRQYLFVYVCDCVGVGCTCTAYCSTTSTVRARLHCATRCGGVSRPCSCSCRRDVTHSLAIEYRYIQSNPMPGGRAIANTLAEVSAGVRTSKALTHLFLSSSEDLKCRNLMCERVGECCVCRLSLSLDRTPQLLELDISSNNLDCVPENLWSLNKLEVLRTIDHGSRKSIPVFRWQRPRQNASQKQSPLV